MIIGVAERQLIVIEACGDRHRAALLLAVVALVALGVGAAYLASPGQMAASELQWARLQYLFGAVQAVAFAGAGWLWGREVHREQARNAEARLDKAQQGETAAVRAAGEAQGHLTTLAEAVVANVTAIGQVHDEVGGSAEPLASAKLVGARGSLSALLALARKYQ